MLMLPPLMTPWVLQPFLLPQFQRPLLDEVNRIALTGRDDVGAC